MPILPKSAYPKHKPIPQKKKNIYIYIYIIPKTQGHSRSSEPAIHLDRDHWNDVGSNLVDARASSLDHY